MDRLLERYERVLYTMALVLVFGFIFGSRQASYHRANAPLATASQQGWFLVSSISKETYFVPARKVQEITHRWRWWITVIRLEDGREIETYTPKSQCCAALDRTLAYLQSDRTVLARAESPTRQKIALASSAN